MEEIEIITNQVMNEERANFLPLISLSEPLFFVINYLENVFLGYVLQDRTVIKDDKRADIRELYISESSFETLSDLFEKKITVYAALNANEEKYRVGKVGNKVFPRKKITDVKEIENRIPDSAYYLDVDLIADLKYQELVINSRKKRLENYKINDNKLYYVEGQNMESSNKVLKFCSSKEMSDVEWML